MYIARNLHQEKIANFASCSALIDEIFTAQFFLTCVSEYIEDIMATFTIIIAENLFCNAKVANLTKFVSSKSVFILYTFLQ